MQRLMLLQWHSRKTENSQVRIFKHSFFKPTNKTKNNRQNPTPPYAGAPLYIQNVFYFLPSLLMVNFNITVSYSVHSIRCTDIYSHVGPHGCHCIVQHSQNFRAIAEKENVDLSGQKEILPLASNSVQPITLFLSPLVATQN